MELGLRRPGLFPGPGDGPGRIAFEDRPGAIARACLRLRCAERVLVPLAEFPAPDFAALEEAAGRAPWEKVLAPGKPFEIKADSRDAKLYHERAVEERLRRAALRRLGSRGEAPAGPHASAPGGGTAPLVRASVEGGRCLLEADASGEPLHRRGYRLETAKAPLRETLAAALLVEARWDPASPLVDPFCGAGTIAIEAALLARGLAPGRGRRFAFMDWPGFDRTAWERERAGVRGLRRAPPLLASDRDAGAVEAARSNARRAGVEEAISFAARALSDAEAPPGRGWVVTNPPYGRRIGDPARLGSLYAAFGRLLRERFPGWKAAFLCPSPDLARATGLPLEAGPRWMNGGLPVRVYRRN